MAATITASGTGKTRISGLGRTRTRGPISGSILGIGDSKTAGDNWLPDLVPVGYARTPWVWVSVDRGVAGATVATTATNLATVLALPLYASHVLMNLGANDVGAMPAEATWKANYLTIIDAVRVILPTVPIYLARAWRRGYGTECNTLATWIADLVTQRPNLLLGMDERIWLQGADDGAAMSTDGIHYSAPGETAATAAWATVLW